jgi:uracil-DNA glycosylase
MAGRMVASTATKAERELQKIVAEARSCRLCADHLPLGPRPVVRAAAAARLMIVGQAPGTRVHETGVPWNDRSGERLRDWLRIPGEVFYDETKVAIVPMGFCYPGVDAKGGDKQDNRPENLELFASNAEHLRHELTGRVPNWTPAGRASLRRAAKAKSRRARERGGMATPAAPTRRTG